MKSMLGKIAVWALITLALVAPAHAMAAADQPVRENAEARDFDYRLGAGDKIRVTTFGEESLTGEFLVGGSGRVSLPLVGELPAAGKTAREFQAEVEGALKQGFIKEPRVSVEILNYRPFYILGEVMKPGEYPYTNGLTVLNAVATAAGFTYRANTKKVFIKRANEAAERSYVLTTGTMVAPGDTVRVPERFF